VTPLPTPGRSGRGSVSEADAALQWLAEAGLRTCSVGFDDDIVRSPGGEQLLLHDPSGNIIELFQPAGC
jgi:hypothetical protein